MPTVLRAAIYARISRDVTGEGLGVARQLADCRQLAASRGWEVAEEYVDNDVSAYRGKRRAEYERMLSDVRDGLRDAVIVYNTDRLTRRPIELEQFTDLCAEAGMTQFATVTTDIDLGNDDGMFMARVLAAVAAKESGRKSARLKRKALENAEAGKPNGGYHRPFGYERDRVTLVESEAAIIRQLADRYLAGEALMSLVRWLNDEGVQTVANGPWRTGTLRQLLTSPRIAGLRAHNGVVVAEAVWPAIITQQRHAELSAAFARKAVTGRRAARRYVLSGMLRCGNCGGRLFSSVRGDRRRYVCSSHPDHGKGCGRLTVVAAPVEEWLTEAVLTRLDTPALADTLAGRTVRDERHAALRSELEADQAQMRELAELWAAKAISTAEWKAAREPIEARIQRAERQLAQATGDHAVNGLAGQGDELRRTWGGLNLTRQAAILAAVLDYATILPGTSGARALDPARVVPTWRL